MRIEEAGDEVVRCSRKNTGQAVSNSPNSPREGDFYLFIFIVVQISSQRLHAVSSPGSLLFNVSHARRSGIKGISPKASNAAF